MMEATTRYPSVFVVDPSLREVPFVPPARRSQKKWQPGQLFLGFLVLLMLSGLAIQAYFLSCFRKELDRAVAQGGTNATFEKFVQDPRTPKEKPSAHLTPGDPSAAMIDGALQWEHKEGFAFLKDMGYEGGSLICSKSGHYYVYSKLNLGYSSCPVKQQKNPIFIHSIYKKTSRYPKEIPLLTSYIPYCNWKDSEQWNHDSFLAGVVYLEERESIFIKVSERRLVRYKDDSVSYFGTFMI